MPLPAAARALLMYLLRASRKPGKSAPMWETGKLCHLFASGGLGSNAIAGVVPCAQEPMPTLDDLIKAR
jgi:hypothetical protein